MFVAFAVTCALGLKSCTLQRVPESFAIKHQCEAVLNERVKKIAANPKFDEGIAAGETFVAECVFIVDENTIDTNSETLIKRILRKHPQGQA